MMKEVMIHCSWLGSPTAKSRPIWGRAGNIVSMAAALSACIAAMSATNSR
jgi:hypothetical protein